ncbi:hypothetical protein [Schaalia sp. ZJ1691]|uniref:hypothetical protein n=1 Tax=Schaalia sp. ZJ1691 TaxID=2709404 RepID=UPI0013ED9A8B|nr:hypothetical protein [Schaalia sp. ZJ1691]
MAMDFNSLTLGDLEYFEDQTGITFSAFDADTMSAKAMRTLAGIALYRDGKATSREAATDRARDLTLEETTALIKINDDEATVGE